MRICIDSSPLLVNSAGVKTYLYHWIQSLRADPSKGDIRLFPPVNLRILNHFQKPPWTYPGIASILAVNYSGLPLTDWFTGGSDIFHMSNLIRRAPNGPRITATIHDTTAWLFPEMHTVRNAGNDKRFAKDVFTRADGLIAVSQSSRDDAVRLLGLAPSKIHVIHPGVAPAYFDVTAQAVSRARKFLAAAKPYCLFVGTIEP
ncbi:MAG: glycosyltransferase, partial [Terriglobia bacterium]